MDVSGLVSGAGGFIASAFVVAGYTMRTMIPLRIFGIITNVFLIAYSLPHHHYAIMALHLILLPLNIYRLREMLLLVREVKKSVNSDLSMAWLKPFMTERKCRTGGVLFYKHEKAEEMFYIVNGRFRLVESGSSCRTVPSSVNLACSRHRTRERGHLNASRADWC